MKELTQEILKELLHYNPDTGEFHWKTRTCKHIANARILKTWNTRHAGNVIHNVDARGYLITTVNNKSYSMHRLAWIYIYGVSPNVIDHINGVTIDNRLCNLKNTTHQGNLLNQKKNSKNTSGVLGVYKNKKTGSWYAQMKFNGKKRHLGSSPSFFEVVCLRKSEERKLGFSLDHGVRT